MNVLVEPGSWVPIVQPRETDRRRGWRLFGLLYWSRWKRTWRVVITVGRTEVFVVILMVSMLPCLMRRSPAIAITGGLVSGLGPVCGFGPMSGFGCILPASPAVTEPITARSGT